MSQTNMRKVVAAITILLLSLLSGLTHTESWVNHVFAGRQEEVQFIHEQITEITWILLLCVFSLLVRFRHRRGVRLYLLAAGFLLLTLAALHSHPFWNSRRMMVTDSWQLDSRITRIHTAGAVVSETGLRLDDVVTAMAFDSFGNLWLSTPSNGPYCFQVHTGEIENLLRPDVVYAFYPDSDGMWVMTSQGAFLYRGAGIIRSVHFPEGVIPLCAVRVGDRRLFGTTRGLFSVRGAATSARQELAADRITQLYPVRGAVLVAGDSGLWRWTGRGTAPCAQIRHRTLSGIIGSADRTYAATGEDGILLLRPKPVNEIRFAVPELNIISPGAVSMHRDVPCFGAYTGAVVYRSGNLWKQSVIGEFPVTALASNGEALYTWTGGRLVEVKLPE